VDLEDAVAPEDRAAARSGVAGALRHGGLGVPTLVRVSAATSDEFGRDVAALEPVAHRLAAIMLAKTETPAQVDRVRALLGGVPVVALIETALGVAGVEAVSAAHGVARLAFGAIDLSLDLDSVADDDVLLPVRLRLAVASRVAGIAPPLDSPSTDIRDEAAVRRAAEHARRVGFGGMLCIHPAQVPAVAATFMPTADDVQWARRVSEAGPSAAQVDGRMVDRPLLVRAARILDRAKGAEQ
jgi:citrate lyase subunit beta/citryl-CoA lyase